MTGRSNKSNKSKEGKGKSEVNSHKQKSKGKGNGKGKGNKNKNNQQKEADKQKEAEDNIRKEREDLVQKGKKQADANQQKNLELVNAILKVVSKKQLEKRFCNTVTVPHDRIDTLKDSLKKLMDSKVIKEAPLYRRKKEKSGWGHDHPPEQSADEKEDWVAHIRTWGEERTEKLRKSLSEMGLTVHPCFASPRRGGLDCGQDLELYGGTIFLTHPLEKGQPVSEDWLTTTKQELVTSIERGIGEEIRVSYFHLRLSDDDQTMQIMLAVNSLFGAKALHDKWFSKKSVVVGGREFLPDFPNICSVCKEGHKEENCQVKAKGVRIMFPRYWSTDAKKACAISLGGNWVRSGPCFMDIIREPEKGAEAPETALSCSMLSGAEVDPLPLRGADMCERCGRSAHGMCTVGRSAQEMAEISSEIQKKKRSAQKTRREKQEQSAREEQNRKEQQQILNQKKEQQKAEQRKERKKEDYATFLRWATQVHLKGFQAWKQLGLCFSFARDGRCTCGSMCNHRKLGLPSVVKYGKNMVYPRSHDLRGQHPCWEFCDTGTCRNQDDCRFAHVHGAKYVGNLISTQKWKDMEGDTEFEQMQNFEKYTRNLLSESIKRENARLPEVKGYKKRNNQQLEPGVRPVCRDFKRGHCKYQNCKWLHAEPKESQLDKPWHAPRLNELKSLMQKPRSKQTSPAGPRGLDEQSNPVEQGGDRDVDMAPPEQRVPEVLGKRKEAGPSAPAPATPSKKAKPADLRGSQ